METTGSVFQKGGGGTNFEQSVQALYLLALTIRGHAPCIASNQIEEVAFQTTNRGYKTDDLLVITRSSRHTQSLLVHIKYNVTISNNDSIFLSVINDFWLDFNNAKIFNKDQDSLVLFTSYITKRDRKHLVTILNWAKVHSSTDDFISEIDRIQAKKKYLDLLRACVTKVNSDIAPSDLQLWFFCRCLNIVEFDLSEFNTPESNNLLSIISLSKVKTSKSTNREIWESIVSYASTLNKNGGSLTIDSVKNAPFFSHFDPIKISPFSESIVKLRNASHTVLAPLKNTVGQVHLNRTDIIEALNDTVQAFTFTIVTGQPGAGKSSIVKDWVNQSTNSSNFLAFKADQFNVPHLANVLSLIGVNESIQDLLSIISTLPEKYVILDGIEKLLEGDPDNSFKQFISLTRSTQNLKVIFTGRRYSIDLIIEKYGLPKDKIGLVEVPLLTDSELRNVHHTYPLLGPLLRNKKIQSLLRSPKYLDYTITASSGLTTEGYKISLKAFKQTLWDILIKNIHNSRRGLSLKRENAFMEVSLSRARKMQLYIKPTHADPEALELLEHDGMLFQNLNTGQYSPAHDILEDWALVKHIESTYNEHDNETFFSSLGNEPAIRRAFRLWVEELVVDDFNSIKALISFSIKSKSLNRYWSDEMLIALFKSNNCATFFTQFEVGLLNLDSGLLVRCIHLLQTACMQSLFSKTKKDILIPVGSGWSATFSFIRSNIAVLDRLRPSICSLLFNWKIKLLYSNSDSKEELDVKIITTYYLVQVENHDEFWIGVNSNPFVEMLISILFNLCHISQEEIVALVNRAFASKDTPRGWRTRSLYKSIINMLLTGAHSKKIASVLPQLIVNSAWKSWKLSPSPEEPNPIGYPIGSKSRRWSNEECWGISNDQSFFPPHIYKTPIFHLLLAHPEIGLSFLVKFLNYSVNFYVESDCEYKRPIYELNVSLPGGKTITQFANLELWLAYRGLSVTHYCIESLLQSLEAFLLQTAQEKTEDSRILLQECFRFLLNESNNASTTSVLVSVLLAYPEEVEGLMLPLISKVEYLRWDLSRATQELSALAVYDEEVPFAQELKIKSNQLPHRTRFSRGLCDFILYYQIKVSTLNSKIHETLIGLKSQIKKDDVIWKKILTEIDIRNHRLGEYDKNLGGFPIAPVYDDEISQFIKSNQSQLESQSTSAKDATALRSAIHNSEAFSFKDWLNIYERYKQKDNFDFTFDRPVTLAVLGLRNFKSNLQVRQKKWCLAQLSNTITVLENQASDPRYALTFMYNRLEQDLALSSFHYLFQSATSANERLYIRQLIALLSAPLGREELRTLLKYMRTTFSSEQPIIHKRVWMGLINLSGYLKSNPYYLDEPNKEALLQAKRDESDFVYSTIDNAHLSADIKDLNFSNYEGFILNRVLSITPYYDSDPYYIEYTRHLIALILNDLILPPDQPSWMKHRFHRIPHDELINSQVYLGELILYSEPEYSKSIVQILFNKIVAFNTNRHKKRDQYDFVRQTFEYTVLKLYDATIDLSIASMPDSLTKKFWNVWRYLFECIKTSDKPLLVQTILLDIKYLKYNLKNQTDSQAWEPLKYDSDLYTDMISNFGKYGISIHVIELFSTVGSHHLPHGIIELIRLIKQDSSAEVALSSNSAERLIKILFYEHISEIKQNTHLISAFIEILDRMIDLGSSLAYLFRENVITYRPRTSTQN